MAGEAVITYSIIGKELCNFIYDSFLHLTNFKVISITSVTT